MESKTSLVGVSDFAGFERNSDMSLWRARTFVCLDKDGPFGNKGSKLFGKTWIYVLARWWINAVDLSQMYFQPAEVDVIEDVRETLEPGKVIICADKTGGYQTLAATGNANRASVLRGEGLRVWVPVAQQGGRQDEAPADRVQTNGKPVVQSKTARTSKDTARSIKGGKGSSNGAGHRGKGVRGSAKNGLRGAGR